MKEAIQEVERKITILQKLVDTYREGQQKQMFQHSLENAKQVLANFREMDRILKGGAPNGI